MWPLTHWVLHMLWVPQCETHKTIHPLPTKIFHHIFLPNFQSIGMVCPISWCSERSSMGLHSLNCLSCVYLIPYRTSCPSSASTLINAADGFK